MKDLPINWEDLRKQKDSLHVAIHAMGTLEADIDAENLTGLLHLIDAIQDHAVDKMGISEQTVFG